MKTKVLNGLMLVCLLAGCASVPKTTLKESVPTPVLNPQCKNLELKIFEVRQKQTESVLLSLGYTLILAGIPEDVVSAIIKIGTSPVAQEVYQEKFDEEVYQLSKKIVDEAGCIPETGAYKLSL